VMFGRKRLKARIAELEKELAANEQHRMKMGWNGLYASQQIHSLKRAICDAQDILEKAVPGHVHQQIIHRP
jgi:cell division septum initiation protein DivIVA